MCTASCMLTRHCRAKWCNACLVIVLTPLKLSSCVLFILCNGKGHASQVTRVIQNSKNTCVDMRWVVHIFQYSKITLFLYSLHDDILDSIYFSLWSVVSLTSVWHHISWYIFYFTYIRKNTIEFLISWIRKYIPYWWIMINWRKIHNFGQLAHFLCNFYKCLH